MSIVRGASPRPIKNYITNDPDGISWIKIGDVSPNAKYITTTAEKITREGAAKSRHLNVGDFILSNSMSFGRPYILKTDGCIHDGWIAMSDFEKIISSGYLYEVLNSELVQKYWKKKANDGGAMSNLNSDIVRGTIIPIPSLTEQERIVGILDTFTASIDNLKGQIAQRRKQFEFYRDQLLDLEGKEGVEMKALKGIVKSYCTGATPNKGHLEYYEGGTIPWLRTQDVKFNEIYEIDSFVTELAVEKTGVKWIPANCVIVAISGATAGRCAINKIPTTTNQHCLNLEIDKEKALYKFVYYCVHNAYVEMISKKQGARGDLNTSIILGIKIPIPSLKEQQRIVSILDTFEASISNLEAQLEQRQKQYEYYRNQLLTFD